MIGISIIKIRRSWDRLILIMEILTPSNTLYSTWAQLTCNEGHRSCTGLKLLWLRHNRHCQATPSHLQRSVGREPVYFSANGSTALNESCPVIGKIVYNYVSLQHNDKDAISAWRSYLDANAKHRQTTFPVINWLSTITDIWYYHILCIYLRNENIQWRFCC